jgi:hypothetical protein
MPGIFSCRLFGRLAFASALVLCPGFAQNPADLFAKAPPDVDEALRARMSGFYQSQVDGKARQAEKYVAEDSKDYYYDMQKPKYLSYEIQRIDYSENFTKAQAVIVVKMYLPFPGFQRDPLPVPIGSRWKVVEGQWYWYYDQEAARMTPFGKMTPGAAPTGANSNVRDVSKGPDVASLRKQVQVDKREVQLKIREASSGEVAISNHLPGGITLHLQPLAVSGLTVQLDREELKGGEKAVVSFHFQPGEVARYAPVTAIVMVQPLNFQIPIKVFFQ